VLGKSEPDDRYVDESEKIRVVRYWIGEVGFELMESTTSDGPVAEWIKKNGEGVMVIGFNVNNTREAVAELKVDEYHFIPDQKGNVARSFRDCEFALIHPRGLNGVIAELIDYRWDELKEGK
jgi:methylmalonyl-CoA/ethylmalonyl-CoA epimerase